jgi:hypothetical protein
MSKVDPINPDYERFPAMKGATGFETTLLHGETIFIPSLWWHYIRYVDGGFSLALRANNSVFTAVRGGMNLVRHTFVDKGMASLLGIEWQHWKEKKAVEKAQQLIAQEA